MVEPDTILVSCTVGAAVLLLYLLAGLFWPGKTGSSAAHVVEEEKEPDPPRNFTLQQLNAFTGEDADGAETPVYVSLMGEVFDVSKGRNFYGKGGSYSMFAGHDVSRNLAQMSFTESDRDTMDWSSLNAGEMSTLEGWVESYKYHKCYPVVGKVVTPPEPRVFTLKELEQYKGKGPVPDGAAAAPIYVALMGKVFDVSYGGTSMYSEGKSYHLFAGRDASRCLAKMSFDQELLDNPGTSGLSEEDMAVLKDWVTKFEEKKLYPVVGTLA